MASKTALLLMDFQVEIVSMIASGGAHEAVGQAAQALQSARGANVPVIFVRVAYRPGYVDVNSRNKRVSMFREKGILADGTDVSRIVPEFQVRSDEPVVTKRRVSALAHTDLIPLLNGLEVDRLVLAGLTTSGVVLSTVRQAADADYRIVVLEDACADPDREVHETLMQRVFPQQAEVMTVAALIAQRW